MLENLNFNEDVCFGITTHYRRYMDIPSLSGKEDSLADELMDDFAKDSVKIAGCPVWMGEPESPFIHICHIDRIPVEEDYNIVENYSDIPYLRGQLDNSICVAVLKEMYNRGYSFNVIFTREEEIVKPHMYVIKVLEELKKSYNRNPKDWILIDTDIDIAYRKDSWINCISIRDKDNMGDFYKPMVRFCRNVADSCNIPYASKTDWVIGSIGFCNKYFGLRGNYVGLPILNYHTNQEIVSLETLNRYYDFMVAVSENYKLFKDSKDGEDCSCNRLYGSDRELYDRVTVEAGV